MGEIDKGTGKALKGSYADRLFYRKVADAKKDLVPDQLLSDEYKKYIEYLIKN